MAASMIMQAAPTTIMKVSPTLETHIPSAIEDWKRAGYCKRRNEFGKMES
jgi:hypothetical protein